MMLLSSVISKALRANRSTQYFQSAFRLRQHYAFAFSNASRVDYYKLLNVTETATQDEIKKQFHKFVKKYHPDIVGASPSNDEKFKELSVAYDTLSDPDKRAKYDSDRRQYQQQNSESQQRGNFNQGSSSNSSSSSFQSRFHRRRQNNQHEEQDEFEYASAYARAKMQGKNEDPRYKTSRDYDSFEKRDFDSGSMAREGFIENMKDAPELWILTGIMGLLLLRWMFLATTEASNQNLQPDDDFEYAQPRGRIVLKEEDIQGLSLQQLDKLDRTGKYVLPARVKSGVEEFRSIAKSINVDIDSVGKGKRNPYEEYDSFGDEEEEDEDVVRRKRRRDLNLERQISNDEMNSRREGVAQKISTEIVDGTTAVTTTTTTTTVPATHAPPKKTVNKPSFNYANKFAAKPKDVEETSKIEQVQGNAATAAGK